MLHRSRNSGRDFWWNQLPCGPVLAPISCTKFKIHSMYEDNPVVPKQVFFFSSAGNLECGTSQCFTDQETREEIFWWNQLPCWPVLTPISCTKLKIHSVMKRVLVLTQVLIFHLLCGTKSMLHRSRNSGRDFWWNQLPCGPVLTPISCTKLKIHSVHPDSPIVPKQVFFFYLVLAIWMWDQSMLHRSRNSEEILGGTSSLVGQFLHPSPVQSSRSILHMKTVQLFLNKCFSLVLAIWMRDQFMLHRSKNSGKDFWWNQLPCGPVLTPISCTKFTIHSEHEHSPIVP